MTMNMTEHYTMFFGDCGVLRVLHMAYMAPCRR